MAVNIWFNFGNKINRTDQVAQLIPQLKHKLLYILINSRKGLVQKHLSCAEHCSIGDWHGYVLGITLVGSRVRVSEWEPMRPQQLLVPADALCNENWARLTMHHTGTRGRIEGLTAPH